MNVCENCGRQIGNLETPNVWRGSVVCLECCQRLQGTISLAPPAIQDPLEALAQALPRGSMRPTYVQNVYHQSRQPHVQTIEKTGKVWKAHMALSALLALVGVGIVIVGNVPDVDNPFIKLFGGLAIAIGLVWYIFARVGAWWHHG
jgi:hypothetical protein